MKGVSNTQREALAELAARQSIEQCLATHARGIDRADEELLRSAYHEGAEVTYGVFNGPAGEFAAMLAQMQRQAPVTLHRPSNVSIQLRGERAVAESYVIAYAESEVESAMVQSLIGGRYLDRLERRAGQWRLSHRTYVLDWNINQPSTASRDEASMASGHFLPFGAHGARDPGNLYLTMAAADPGSRRQPKEGAMSDALSNDEIDAVLTRPLLQELTAAYCRGADRTDEELLRSVFHPDATVVTGVFNGSARDFAREITRSLRESTVRTFHTVSNHWFRIEGDQAVGECYVIALQTAKQDGEEHDILTGGRYVDRFERREGVWKIAQRTFVMDWNINQRSTAMMDEGMFADMIKGARRPDDPVYELWSTGSGAPKG